MTIDMTRIRTVLQDQGLRCVGLPATGGLEIQHATGDARIYPGERQSAEIEEVARGGKTPSELRCFPLSWAVGGERPPSPMN